MSTELKTDIITEINDLIEEITEQRFPAKLILFNDDDHDMLEVMNQLVLAIDCSEQKAQAIMLEAHKQGSAVALRGKLDTIKKAAKILQEIDLKIEIEEN